MAREIKFRGFIDGEMHYPTISQGYENAVFGSGPLVAFSDDERKRMAIMQFTGLKLKGGKELYFGDIVKHNDNVYVCCFSENMGFALIHKKNYNTYNGAVRNVDNWRTFMDVHRMARHCEIIGNIYEHPELTGAHQSNP